MKKAIIIMLLLALCFVVYACKNKTEERLSDRLSYLERSFFIGESTDFLVFLRYGFREMNPIFDGKVEEKEDFLSIELIKLRTVYGIIEYELGEKSGIIYEKKGELKVSLTDETDYYDKIVLKYNGKTHTIPLLTVEKNENIESLLKRVQKVFSEKYDLKGLTKYEISLSYLVENFRLYRYVVFYGDNVRYSAIVDCKTEGIIADSREYGV